MKLVACPQCHAQYDLALRPESGGTFACRCGATLEAVPPKGAADAPAERCSACGALAKSGEEVCAFCGSGIVPSVDPGSLICPECFARNADESRFCAGCGVAFEPQPWPTADADDAAKCPCCDRAMNVREVGGVVVHECGKCNGLWVPLDRFTALVERAAETARARVAEGSLVAPRVDGDNPASRQVEYRRCPVCAELMARRNHQKRSGVIIDQCHEHGTWLDANELERIAGWVLSGKAQRVADVEAERAELRERAAADEAVRRVKTEVFREQGLRGLFGADAKPTGHGTLLDFLSTLLD